MRDVFEIVVAVLLLGFVCAVLAPFAILLTTCLVAILIAAVPVAAIIAIGNAIGRGEDKDDA